MQDVVQKGHVALKSIAREIPKDAIKSERIQKIILRMQEALSACADGVALAAPQIGESVRIFIVHPRTWKGETPPKGEHLVYINPIITKRSQKKETMDEGCLSVRGVYGKTRRSTRATVEALDENGVAFSRGAGGLLAQIFQHETDHLNGILFIDHATELVRAEPAKSENESSK